MPNTPHAPVFVFKRGTFDQNGSGLKGDVEGSDKSVAFALPCDPAKTHVSVFESPIDLMSYMTLHRELTGNAVALCKGLSDLRFGVLDLRMQIGNTVCAETAKPPEYFLAPFRRKEALDITYDEDENAKQRGDLDHIVAKEPDAADPAVAGIKP